MALELEQQFEAYGVRIRLRADNPRLFDALGEESVRVHLPFGWRPIQRTAPAAAGSIRYEIGSDGLARSSSLYKLCADEAVITEGVGLSEIARALGRHAELLVAERAPAHLFVHAGVVGWKGRAIVMPGASFAGKTSLVQAWLEAGATYYSDEFAVLDRAGHVHPFARPLAVRDPSAPIGRRVPAEALGADVGRAPMPVGLVMVTSYRPGISWRPRRLTAARGLLALMRHTVAARGSPSHSMPILKRVVMGALVLTGSRGEARAAVTAALSRIASTPW
jgi:hypothetical protein